MCRCCAQKIIWISIPYIMRPRYVVGETNNNSNIAAALISVQLRDMRVRNFVGNPCFFTCCCLFLYQYLHSKEIRVPSISLFGIFPPRCSRGSVCVEALVYCMLNKRPFYKGSHNGPITYFTAQVGNGVFDECYKHNQTMTLIHHGQSAGRGGGDPPPRPQPRRLAPCADGCAGYVAVDVRRGGGAEVRCQ